MKHKILRPIIACCGIFLLSIPAFSQVQLVRQVVASSGGTNNINGVMYEYTIGEIAIVTFASGSRIVSQGFHQPEVLPKPPLATNIASNFVAFPNPAKSTLKIQLDLASPATVTAMMMNSAGQVVFQDVRDYGAGKITLPIEVEKFASGIYNLIVKVNGYVFTDKIVVQ
ncbi:putative secreted protein (Por secretion system target) [Chitinophaga skermanii]|uniref:Putative secreted protein (Por secretion system target) n=1 Tax=Chitinophaga skermanii TaxID=331697 RepID=A0A327Q7H2_9BACT|nr:T9SS type A sorting domain-containing protein [Chitinophaga skermanii]RAI99813.1 putative secreted protein (Por secretion system target) [Chitinophaga skermanii]